VVFRLDEDQAVRPGQIGTRDYIQTAAQACGATVRTVGLDSQDRSRSPRYDGWVRSLLGLDDGPFPPAAWNGEEGFELRVADSPHELEQILRATTELGASARMTAGYCWPFAVGHFDDVTPQLPAASASTAPFATR
jgi:hypothetical protein